MNLPFTTEQFLNFFKEYNESIWPVQILAYLLGLAVLVAILRPRPGSAKFVFGALAIFWLWNGIACHFIYFRQINPAAAGFAVMFVIQALLFGWVAFRARDIEVPAPLASGLGWAAIAYGMVGYPLLNQVFGHQYPTMPVFGVAPCPTTIFTFGVLMLLGRTVPGWLLIGPIMWATIGTSAAFQLGIREDLGLPIAGAMALIARLTLRPQPGTNGKTLKRGTTSVAGLLLVAALPLAWLALSSSAHAHCDTLDGPVVAAAKVALSRGDVTSALKWIKAENEPELKAAFAAALRACKSPEARALADRYFFETLVRLHREGEGAPYTGLKPAGTKVEPIVRSADAAIANGSATELVGELSHKLEAGIKRRLASRSFARFSCRFSQPRASGGFDSFTTLSG